MSRAARRALPRTVWALGLVSLLMDGSSELVHALLPLYMTSVLGASMLEVGLIEGVAEGIAAITKVFSGTLSDWLGRRKLLVVLGYGLAALSKPLFPLANSIALVAGARFMDRVGKGIRGAPRDALIADVTPLEARGAAYGLRQALDSVGAVLGPLAAVALMALYAESLRAVLWAAAAPALAAVLVLAFAVREPEGVRTAKANSPLSKAMLGQLGARYWLVVGLGAVLTLARFSEAFLVLRAADVGLAQTWVPLVMVAMSAAYALASYPAGLAADRGWERALIGWGLAALIAADLILGSAQSAGAVFAGVALWGVHMGLTQGLLSVLVAAAAPAEARGTAFGVFNLVIGVVLIGASLLAGWLWQTHGPAATFYAGAAFTAVALAGLLAAARAR
ncbi:MAG: MFS transporter [Burkholderiales bacterium]